jgi:hypothetical protein
MQSLTTVSNLDTPLRKNLIAIFFAGLLFWSSMSSQLPGQPHTFLNKREYISQQSAKAKQ